MADKTDPPRLTAFAFSLPSDALINVGHKSSSSKSQQTRPANVTEPQVKVVEKEARGSRQQAENRWQQAESQEPQGERGRWLLRLTRAASSPTGEPSLSQIRKLFRNKYRVVHKYTNILPCLHHSHAQIHRDSCINTDLLS